MMPQLLVRQKVSHRLCAAGSRCVDAFKEDRPPPLVPVSASSFWFPCLSLPSHSNSIFILGTLEMYVSVLKEEREAETSSPWTCNILWTTDKQSAWLIVWLSQ
ncbi:hypothetical protein ILYODFUR_022678 [Ilyodon furcidens]|uniref:Uncharacterized protein n=1 Tax=Ilyodon furcidens TaxID=33524 RepID=A0ABV0V598_9TELE